VGLADLETIVTRLRSGGCWNISRAQFVAKLDEMLPMEGDLEHATLGHRHGGGLFNMRPDWLSFACEGSTARPPRDFPEHLSDAPPRQQFTTGQWATEFVFEHDAPTPRLSEKNHWVLPRSWRMAEAFKATYSEAPRGERFAARTSRTGSLVLFESIDRPVQSVSIPTSIDAIRHALSRDGKWTRRHGYRGPLVPGNRVEWLSPSNEARYLNGVLGMAGGFDYARRSLLHPFMVNLFALLGGSPIPPSDKIAPIVQRLQERGRLNSAFDLSDEAEREALGTLIAKAARTLKSPSAFVKYTDIADRWRAHREAYWQRYGEKPAGDPNVDWEAHEQASVDSCLIKMRAQQLIFQGHQWTCPECHHRNWVDLSELRPILSCSICRHEDDAPIIFHSLWPDPILVREH
jgi:hypothetical protein